jgi:uncharacterized protein
MPNHQRNPVQPFQVMLKPRGAVCDLDCHYCYYLSKERLYPDGDFRMSPEVLEAYTRSYIESQPGPEITFAWQGGEPLLMGIDFFRQAIEFQHRYHRPGTRILNSLQTNGTALDEAWCRLFHDHGFLIGISLDGPAHLHDAYRLDKAGRPTHERVMEAIRLMQETGVDFNVLTTVHAANVPYPLDVYRFIRDEIGAEFLQFIPIVERENETGFQEGDRVTDRSVSGPEYGNFLIEVFDEWVNRDVGEVFVQIFDVSLAAWVGLRPGLCIFEETCGGALALEHNGDLYACDHYVEPRYLLGNIINEPMEAMVSSDRQQAFGRAKHDDLPGYCRNCEVRFVCNGGCPKNRILSTPEGEPGLNYLCEGYKAFFLHVDRAMRFMADELAAERPPAGIMEGFAAEHYPPASVAGSKASQDRERL